MKQNSSSYCADRQVGLKYAVLFLWPHKKKVEICL